MESYRREREERAGVGAAVTDGGGWREGRRGLLHGKCRMEGVKVA